MAGQSMGLSLLPKLKQEHLVLTSYSRMRASLAAKVQYYIYIYKHYTYVTVHAERDHKLA